MLDLDWLSLPPAQGFAALSALRFEAKQRLFAWCIAACLKPQLAIEDRADPVIKSQLLWTELLPAGRLRHAEHQRKVEIPQ